MVEQNQKKRRTKDLVNDIRHPSLQAIVVTEPARRHIPIIPKQTLVVEGKSASSPPPKSSTSQNLWKEEPFVTVLEKSYRIPHLIVDVKVLLVVDLPGHEHVAAKLAAQLIRLPPDGHHHHHPIPSSF